MQWPVNISKLTTILLLLVSFNSYSQTLIDTLNDKLNSDISIQEKLDLIKEYSNPLLYSYPDTLVYYSNYALKMCKISGNKKDKITFTGLLSEAHFRLSNYSEALKYAFESVKLCEASKDSNELAATYNNIGSIYRVSNKLDEAKEYFEKSVTIRLALKDSEGIASSYNNIGIIYMMTSSYDTGMTYWGNALDIKLAIGDSFGAATTMNNMAMYYRDIGETDKALDYFNKVRDIKQRYKDYTSISMVYLNLGELYLKQDQYEKAKDYYEMALDEAEKSKSKQLISHAHLKLAEIYYDHKEYKTAYDHYIEHSNLEDTIFSEETMNNLDEIESKYQNEKKALLIENLEKDKKIQKERQTLIIFSSSLGLLAMLIIVLIILKNYRQKKKDHLLISEQKNILFEKNKEITDSITYARRLQEAILPPPQLFETHLSQSFVLFNPKDVVSGDFYWMETVSSLEGGLNVDNHHPSNSPQGENLVLFAVADCTGHGVPGAMVSVVCSNALNRAVKEFNLTEPAKILDKVRELVIETFEKSSENVKDGMDICLCSLEQEGEKWNLQYAGANNPLWILRKNSKEIEEIKADKQPIGIHLNPEPFTNHQTTLNKGDIIYLFSDGFADQFGGDKGKKMKYKPFKDILVESANLNMKQQCDILTKKFNSWKGDMEQVDDVCVIGVHL